ncbi:MAG: hypothetical protein K6E63_01855 [Lachnospiraceae bacterium]|nr:hypothetical protein [Lachnospiraceae bacterium]
MKYCKKCGMLLEDNMEICIGCGTDVTKKGSYTRFPEAVEKQIEIEKKEAGRKNLGVFAIILVFVVMLLMVGIFVSQLYINMSAEDADKRSSFAQRLMESMTGGQGNIPSGKKKEVKDDAGAYYKQVTVKDGAGHDVFYAVYPEDLGKLDHSIDYQRESQKYPSAFTFIATNDENTTQLTYTSPQHYQYISMSDGGDITTDDVQYTLQGAASFYNFTSVETYLKEIIGQAYPSARKIEEMGSKEVSAQVNESFDNIVKTYEDAGTDGLAKLFGLPETTQFTHNNTYKSNKLMDYRILTKEDHAVSCRFYVPVFCAVYDYTDETTGIYGQVLDCYILTVSSFEAGSDELYDWYEDAFEMFIDNFKLTDDFFMLNDAYAKSISDAVSSGRLPEFINDDKAGEMYNSAGETGKLSKAIETFMDSHAGEGTKFSEGEYVINTPNDIKVVYINPEKELVYVSPDENDYPGDEFTELKVN